MPIAGKKSAKKGAAKKLSGSLHRNSSARTAILVMLDTSTGPKREAKSLVTAGSVMAQRKTSAENEASSNTTAQDGTSDYVASVLRTGCSKQLEHPFYRSRVRDIRQKRRQFSRVEKFGN